MPAPFTPADAALLLINHRVGTMQLIRTMPLEVAKRNTLALAKAARMLDLPAVLTSSQEDRLQGPLMPELREIVPRPFEERVRRAGIVNAWTDPNFRTAALETGRRNLVMAGVTTDACLSTRRSAPSPRGSTSRP